MVIFSLGSEDEKRTEGGGDIQRAVSDVQRKRDDTLSLPFFYFDGVIAAGRGGGASGR